MPIYRGSTKVEVGQLKIGDQDVKEVYLGATKIWPEAVALQPALIPTFAADTPYSGGFTVVVTNYDASFSWSVTTTAGSATIDGAGVVTNSGLVDGQSATVTVTTSKPGHHNGSGSKIGNAADYVPPPPPQELKFDNPSNGGYQGGGTFISYTAMGSGVGNAADCSGTAVIGWDVKHAGGMVAVLVETKTVPCTFTDTMGGVRIEIEGSPSTALNTCNLEGSAGGRSLRKRIVQATVTNPNGSVSTFSSLTNWNMGTLTSCE